MFYFGVFLKIAKSPKLIDYQKFPLYDRTTIMGVKKFMLLEVEIKSMQTNFGGHGPSGFKVMAPLQNG